MGSRRRALALTEVWLRRARRRHVRSRVPATRARRRIAAARRLRRQQGPGPCRWTADRLDLLPLTDGMRTLYRVLSRREGLQFPRGQNAALRPCGLAPTAIEHWPAAVRERPTMPRAAPFPRARGRRRPPARPHAASPPLRAPPLAHAQGWSGLTGAARARWRRRLRPSGAQPTPPLMHDALMPQSVCVCVCVCVCTRACVRELCLVSMPFVLDHWSQCCLLRQSARPDSRVVSSPPPASPL